MYYLHLFWIGVQFWSHQPFQIQSPVNALINQTFALEYFQFPIWVQSINQGMFIEAKSDQTALINPQTLYLKFKLLSRERNALESLQCVICHLSPLLALSLTSTTSFVPPNTLSVHTLNLRGSLINPKYLLHILLPGNISCLLSIKCRYHFKSLLVSQSRLFLFYSESPQLVLLQES